MKYYTLIKQSIAFISFIIAEIIMMITTMVGFFHNHPLNDYILLNIVLILNVIIFYNYFVVCHYFKQKANQQSKIDIIKHQLKLQEEYELIRAENNKIYHEIKNQIFEHLDEQSSAETYSLNENEIMQLIDQKALSFETSQCNNDIVDAILYNKLLLCRHQQIEVESAVYLPKQIKMEDIDLISLYSNLFDNAIEACQHVQHQPKKIIIQSRIIHHYLVINIKNSYVPDLIRPHFFTTKKDQSHHGFGMKIIDMIVKKYHGTLIINKDQPMIEFQITLKLPQ
ncbi:sensor histidine kinase [[Clostridium] spiroforme]|nr:sensor histidine kinase [Thomasclavelia spiroformis]